MGLARIDHDGGGSAAPTLIAHGLFGTARNWGASAKRLSARGPVSVIDMRNHGSSPWFETHSYADLGQDILAELPKGGDLIGHSMGGKAAMVAALTAPDHIRRLVVADIAPVPYSHVDQQLDLIDAMRSVDLDTVASRRDADAQLADRITEDPVRAFLLQSLDLKEKRWRFNLDALAAEMPQIIGFPELSGAFEGPTLFLTGADSDYVRTEHRERIKELFPKARFAKIPGAGHWLHADKPREFLAAVSTFLDA
jgi:pimeloyl-ACP methyl ester carboxylesterase